MIFRFFSEKVVRLLCFELTNSLGEIAFTLCATLSASSYLPPPAVPPQCDICGEFPRCPHARLAASGPCPPSCPQGFLRWQGCGTTCGRTGSRTRGHAWYSSFRWRLRRL